MWKKQHFRLNDCFLKSSPESVDLSYRVTREEKLFFPALNIGHYASDI